MVSPDVWGPPMWRFLHLAALGYPEEAAPEDAERYARFFEALGGVLPCPSCAANYQTHLAQLPVRPFLGGRDALFDWTVRLHNMVNAESGKSPVTVEQARDAFLRAIARGGKSRDGTAALKRAVWAGLGGGEPLTLAAVGGGVLLLCVAIVVWLGRRRRALV